MISIRDSSILSNLHGDYSFVLTIKVHQKLSVVFHREDFNETDMGNSAGASIAAT